MAMIGIYALSCVLLAACFVGLKVWPATRTTLSGMQESFAVVSNPDMDDDAKEAAIRAGAIRALGHALSLAARLALCVGAAVLPVWLAQLAGALTFNAFIAFSLRLDVILATVAVFAAIGIAMRSRKTTAAA